MPGNEDYGSVGMQMERPVVAEPVVAEPEVAEPEEIPSLTAKYPEATDLFATGGSGKRIFTDEELHFYSKAIKIYTNNTLKALDLLFPIVGKPSGSGVMLGKRPSLDNMGSVVSIPNIPFYNDRISRGTDVQDILQRVVLVMEKPPYPDSPEDLREVAQILINGVKRIDGKREGITGDYVMFEQIKEKIKEIEVEILDDDRRRKLIEKIDHAMGIAEKMFANLKNYAINRSPWSTELPDLRESQPSEPQSPVRPTPAAAPASSPAAAARAPAAPTPSASPSAAASPVASAVEEKGERRCRGDIDCFPDAPNCGKDGFCSGARAMVGGKRKRKHKQTRKTHKRSKNKHSKYKKSHKRKKTLKRKYKKNKGSKRR